MPLFMVAVNSEYMLLCSFLSIFFKHCFLMYLFITVCAVVLVLVTLHINHHESATDVPICRF